MTWLLCGDILWKVTQDIIDRFVSIPRLLLLPPMDYLLNKRWCHSLTLLFKIFSVLLWLVILLYDHLSQNKYSPLVSEDFIIFCWNLKFRVSHDDTCWHDLREGEGVSGGDYWWTKLRGMGSPNRSVSRSPSYSLYSARLSVWISIFWTMSRVNCSCWFMDLLKSLRLWQYVK